MTELEKQLAYLQSPKENLNQVNKLKKKLEMAQLAERVLGYRIRCDYMYGIFDSTGKTDEAVQNAKKVWLDVATERMKEYEQEFISMAVSKAMIESLCE